MRQIGWIVSGPDKKGKNERKKLVWQPTEEAIRVSYARLIKEGWEESALDIEPYYGAGRTKDSGDADESP